MKLPSEPAICLFDVFCRGAAVDTEHLIMICHVLC